MSLQNPVPEGGPVIIESARQLKQALMSCNKTYATSKQRRKDANKTLGTLGTFVEILFHDLDEA